MWCGTVPNNLLKVAVLWKFYKSWKMSSKLELFPAAASWHIKNMLELICVPLLWNIVLITLPWCSNCVLSFSLLFWHIRLTSSLRPICQRNGGMLLMWQICQRLKFEMRWILHLAQKQSLLTEESYYRISWTEVTDVPGMVHIWNSPTARGF